MERTAAPHYSLTVQDSEDHLARVDVVAGRRFPGLSRRVVRTLRAAIYLNDRRVAPSHRVRLGDRLELRLPQAEPAFVPFVALATTADFVFVAKPGGVHTHRLRPIDPPALADVVVEHHPECATASPDPREGGAIHRLDGATSGVVAFARHRHAWEDGRRAIAERATKLYVAWVAAAHPPRHATPHAWPRPHIEAPVGAVGSDLRFVVDAPLRDAGRRVLVDPDGRSARTEVWAAPVHEDQRFVVLRLHGGRRHQLRAHLAHAGWPIVGDSLYGDGSDEGPLLLHAIRLELDPGRVPAVEAPIPIGWPAPLS